MQKFTYLLLLFVFSYHTLSAQTDKRYIHSRESLANSFHRFMHEKKGCVAFLGGSITEMKGWRNMIQDDLRQRFPDTEFTFIDAGLPSAGSTPHAFRFNADVLQNGTPDLLFVEAAVNDDTNGFKPKEQIRGMEGIIRHALLANRNMDIVMLHFVYAPFIPLIEESKHPDVIMNHERVANHYHVTSINLAQEIVERMNANEFTWKEFGGTHPHWKGHTYYAATIKKLFDKEMKGITRQTVKPHYLPETTLDEYSYYQGDFIGIQKATKLAGFNYIPNWKPASNDINTREGFVNVPMLAANQPEATFSLAFTGKAIGIFCVSGPEAGVLQYSIDDRPFKELDTYTKWSSKVYLPWVYMFDTELNAGKHTLTVKIKEGKRSRCIIKNFVVNK